MAKYAAILFVLVVAYCVEGIRIKPQPLGPTDAAQSEPVYPNLIRNDPRCVTNGLFPDLENCTTYFVCVDGTSQTRNCPDGTKFDTYRHCTYAEDADCGVARTDSGLSCPEDYGIFNYDEDCHKYLTCTEGVPRLNDCPEGQWYQKHVGCVIADQCPQSPSSNSINDIVDN